MAAPEHGFTIDGVIYEVPVVFTFDMEEAQWLYDSCGLTLGDFVETPDDDPDDVERRQGHFKNPAFVKTLMRVAYQRAHPDMNPARVERLIAKAQFLEAISTMKPAEAEAPLDEPQNTTAPSENGTPSESEHSGTHSNDDSDQPAATLEPTGIGGSGTSSPESVPTMSAA